MSASALDRALGRRDLTLFAINRVIGAGIFGIPAVLYAGVGPLSVAAFLLAALIISLITLCFAEVGSAYRDTGGPYLYAYRTFGPLVGFEVGWLMWVTQLGGFATVINLFVNYVGWFLPSATSGLPRAAIIATVAIGLTVVNVLGVRRAATINNILTLGKLIPLALFVVVGAFFVETSRFALTNPPTAVALSGAVLVAVYAFSGFEVLGVPSGEIADPAQDGPVRAPGRACCRGGGLRRRAGGHDRYAARSGHVVPGRWPMPPGASSGGPGATVMVTGALLSTLGVSHAILLAAGRMPFAMAERRQLPATIAAVHPCIGRRTSGSCCPRRRWHSSPSPPPSRRRSRSRSGCA